MNYKELQTGIVQTPQNELKRKHPEGSLVPGNVKYVLYEILPEITRRYLLPPKHESLPLLPKTKPYDKPPPLQEFAYGEAEIYQSAEQEPEGFNKEEYELAVVIPNQPQVPENILSSAPHAENSSMQQPNSKLISDPTSSNFCIGKNEDEKQEAHHVKVLPRQMNEKLFEEQDYEKLIQSFFLQNAGIAVSDVSNVDYIPANYRQNKMHLDPVTNLFVDTVQFITYVQPCVVECKGKMQHLLKLDVAKSIANNVSTILTKCGIKTANYYIQKPISMQSESPMTVQLKDFLNNTEKGKEIKKELCRRPSITTEKDSQRIDDLYWVGIKVDVNENTWDNLVKQLPFAIEDLCKFLTHLQRFDVAQDCAGTLSKEDLINHLTLKEFSKVKGTRFINKTYLDDDDSVGKDCFTFFITLDGIPIRAKIYNKFVCQLTQGGSVEQKFGNHLRDVITENSRVSTTLFNDKISKAGYTRVEISFYSINEFKPDHVKNLSWRISEEYLGEYDNPLFYCVPTSVQWQQLESTLKCNMSIFDKTHRSLYTAFWVNTKTKRITGTCWKAREAGITEMNYEKLKKHYKDMFTFVDLPMHCLEIEFDHGKILTRQESVIKCQICNKEPVYTYVGASKRTFIRGTVNPLNPIQQSKTPINFMTSSKFRWVDSKLFYSIKDCKELAICINLTMDKNAQSKNEYIKALTIEKQKARLTLMEENKQPVCEEAKVKLQKYIECEELQAKKRKPLQELAKGFACLPKSLLKQTVEEWLFDPGLGKCAPKGFKCYKTHVKALRLLLKFDVANGSDIYCGRMLCEDGNVFEIDNYMKWAISRDNSEYVNHTSIRAIQGESMGTNTKWLYYGVAPNYCVPIMSLIVNGFIKQPNGNFAPKYDLVKFLNGWDLMRPLQNSAEAKNMGSKIEVLKQDLGMLSVPNADIVGFIWNPELLAIKKKNCRKCNEIPKGAKVLITEMCGDFKTKTGWHFRFRGKFCGEVPALPQDSKAKVNAPFVCTAEMNRLFAPRIEEIKTRVKAISAICLGKGYSEANNAISKFEVLF